MTNCLLNISIRKRSSQIKTGQKYNGGNFIYKSFIICKKRLFYLAVFIPLNCACLNAHAKALAVNVELYTLYLVLPLP